jgi:hypothetical protein
MKVLVHYSVNRSRAYGVWWVDPFIGITSYYLDPDSAVAARGRVLMMGKTNDQVSWENWFDTLASSPPYFEQWVAYDSMGMSPEKLLTAISTPAAS